MTNWVVPPGLRESMGPTIDHVAQQPGARKLSRALSLGEGFSFQVVVCNTPRVAAALQLWLAEAVALERDPLVIERISPYPLDWRVARPERIGLDDLGESVLAKLVGERGDDDRLVFIDAADADERDADAWRVTLMRLNEGRNRFARDLHCALTLILPPWLDVEFARMAPDLWSIRSVAVELRDLDLPASGTAMLRAFDETWGEPEDFASLTAAVEQARQEAASGADASSRALGVLLLRLAALYQHRGDFGPSEQLVEEAFAIAEKLGDLGSMAACQLVRSDLLVWSDRHDEARQLVESAMATFRQVGDEWGLAEAWGRLADILFHRGELDEALRIRQQEELPVYERLGDVRSRAVTLGQVADILFARGDLDEALRIRQQEELPVFEQLGDVR